MNDTIYAVYVAFPGSFSKKYYVYKSKENYGKGQRVIVPANDDWAIAIVKKSTKNHEFKEEINYKFVLGLFDPTDYMKEKK
jgi:primosomal protein N'